MALYAMIKTDIEYSILNQEYDIFTSEIFDKALNLLEELDVSTIIVSREYKTMIQNKLRNSLENKYDILILNNPKDLDSLKLNKLENYLHLIIERKNVLFYTNYDKIIHIKNIKVLRKKKFGLNRNILSFSKKNFKDYRSKMIKFKKEKDGYNSLTLLEKP